MFYYCMQLTTIKVGSGFDTSSVTSSTGIFKNCYALVGGSGTTYSADHDNDISYARIDGGSLSSGYFSSSGVSNGLNMSKAKTVSLDLSGLENIDAALADESAEGEE